MLAGKGIRAVVVMWVMTFLSFILVPLRLYTRIYIVKALGVDDHVFNLAWVSGPPLLRSISIHIIGQKCLTYLQVFLLLYTIFMTIAGYYGFGQSITTLEMDMAVKAVYNEMVGQTFAVLGMAIAKISLGIFLLRIVVKQWHRISIWISMVSLAVVSVMTAIIFWIQKLPSESIYDPRVSGRLVVKVTPFSILLGCKFAFFFSLGCHAPCTVNLVCLILFFSIISLVRGCRLLFCTASVDFHLEAQYEVQGEDVDCNQFEPGIYVSFCLWLPATITT